MRKTRVAGILSIAVLAFATLSLFNNCQPIGESVATFSSSGSNGNGGNGGNGGTQTAGQIYYNTKLRPVMETYCRTCHTLLPKDAPPGMLAPTSIFNYSTARSRVQPGPLSTNNWLFNKARGLNHTGGDQCAGDVSGTTTPCKEIREWVSIEFPLLTDGIAGVISYVSPIGGVRGWLLDPRNPTGVIDLILYVGGPADAGGTMVGTYTANLPGDGSQNGHYFAFDLPAQYRDGVARDFYFYGMSAEPENLLPGQPTRIVAYSYSQEGMDYYNAQIRPALNQCTRCHAVGYDVQFYALLDPTPFNGGTALNNSLINKMSGMNHSGGNFCNGGKNSAPCSLVQQWWRIEFQ